MDPVEAAVYHGVDILAALGMFTMFALGVLAGQQR